MTDDMSPAELTANARATFLPMTDAGEAERPCLVIGGVQVYGYFEDGYLHVSLDLDTAEDAFTRQGRIPMEITVNGRTVYAGI